MNAVRITYKKLNFILSCGEELFVILDVFKIPDDSLWKHSLFAIENTELFLNRNWPASRSTRAKINPEQAGQLRTAIVR